MPLVVCDVGSVESRETDDKHWIDASAILRFTGDSTDYMIGVTCTVRFIDNDGHVVDETVIEADFSSLR